MAIPRLNVRMLVLLVVLTSPASPSLGQPALQEIVFDGAGGLTLEGTLVIPEAKEGERVPAMLLLPGSGPTDRDGNQPPLLVTDLLKQFAERLAADSIATLRFDKRAAPRYAARLPKDPAALDDFLSFESFVADATAAYRLLRSRAGVDPARVIIFGHSEGGLIALRIASDLAATDERPAGIVLVSTAGRVLDEVVREQIAAALSAPGVDEATRTMYLGHLDRGIAALKAGEPLPKDLPPDLLAVLNPNCQKLLHAYFTLDPATLAAGVRGPVLIVQGLKDVQVSAERDTPLLERALKARDGGSVEVFMVVEASHNLKKSQGALDPAFTGPVVPGALDRVSAWCAAQFAK